MYVEHRALRTITGALLAAAGNYRRMRRAVLDGAQFIREDRYEVVDAETVTIYSDSGETYTTSLTDCVNAVTGETCPAFAVGVPCKHRAVLHILRKLYEGDQNGDQECDGCHRRFHVERLRPVDKTSLEPGDVVPSGECPACGSNCYPREERAAA